MQILVLGGTAWLGALVAQSAFERGHEVTCLARGNVGAPPPGAHFVAADRGESAAYEQVVGTQWDAVLDVSWQPGQVRGAVQALAARTSMWVYVSSCSVYAAHNTPGADETATLLRARDGEVAGSDEYGEAKVACEQAVLEGVGGQRTLVARSGLIAGPGDHTDRTGYWPSRFAHPATTDGAVLVPDAPESMVAVIDVRDLAGWLVSGIEQRTTGVFNVAGSAVPLAEHLSVAREVAGHEGELVPVDQEWLEAHEVLPWSGPRSLPLWLPLPEYAGFLTRDTRAAIGAGLVCRPLADTLTDTLAWELSHGPGRVRKAGLSTQDEIELVRAARA